MLRILEAIFRLNIKQKRAETCRCEVLNKKINKVVSDYMLSLYLIIGSKHNRKAFPKNLHLALSFVLDRPVLYVVVYGIAGTGCIVCSGIRHCGNWLYCM